MVTSTQINAIRGEALAKVFLTRHPDVAVQNVQGGAHRRDSIDLIAVVHDRQVEGFVEFGIEVNAYRKRLPSKRLHDLVQRDATQMSAMPLCVFFVDVDVETGLFAWAIKPSVASDGTAQLVVEDYLRSTAPPNVKDVLRPITVDAVDRMVRSVLAWSRASARVLIAS